MTGSASEPREEIAATVRRHDADRYIATLYAPQGLRADLWAVYALAAELAQVPELVSQSSLGEIRLEWWRQTLDRMAQGRNQAARHPVVEALRPLVGAHPIVTAWLRAMIDGRGADLYADPLGDVEALEAYFGATLSLPIRVAIHLTAPDAEQRFAADAAGHGGVAAGLVRMASHFDDVVKRRPELIPLDMAAAHGVTAAELGAANKGPAARAFFAQLVLEAQSHLDRAVEAARNLPPTALPALLPLAPLRGDLRLIARRGSRTCRPLRRGALYRQWSMWRAARRGRII